MHYSSNNLIKKFIIVRIAILKGGFNMQNKAILNEILTKSYKRLDFVRNELRSCPQGKIYEQTKNGKIYYIQSVSKNGKLCHIGINQNQDVVSGLIKRTLLENEAKVLDRNTNALSNCLRKISDYELTEDIIRLKKRCPSITDKMIEESLRFKEQSEWMKDEYEQSNYKEEEKKHVTSRGLKVRSKSELLIAEKLYEYKVDFRYEQVMHIGKTTIVPDFTIRREDGKIIYWEHEGLTNVDSYIKWQRNKADLYASNGIVPWDNFIVTYDNAEGNIDLRIVESEIKNKILI